MQKFAGLRGHLPMKGHLALAAQAAARLAGCENQRGF
jgi:hypothetical protein